MAGGYVGLWPMIRQGLSSVTPFTYRDGITYLELLEAIKKSVGELVHWTVGIESALSALAQRIGEVEANADKAIEKGFAEIRLENAQLKAELLELIAQVSIGGSSFNPTNGTHHESVSKVISDVYDFVRVHAYFAADEDRLSLTATQLDARNFSARHHDLSPLDETNDEMETL